MSATAQRVKMALRWTYHYGLNATAYRLRALCPVDDRRVLVVESSEPKASSNVIRVMRALEERGYFCEFLSLGKFLAGKLRYHALGTKLSWKAAGSRLILLSDANDMVGCLPMREQTGVVQLWHACGAFKKFGLSTAQKRFGDSLKDALRFPGYGNVSLVTVSSPEVRWAYEEAMGLEGRPGVVRALGVSRTDAFFDEGRLAAWREQATSAVPAIEGRRVLLWAPTFRGHMRDAQAPGFLDIPLLRERLGDGWVLLIKHHPIVKHLPAIPADCADWAFDVTRSLPIEAAMVASDACASDYSSLVFEYSLLGRPMAFLAPDVDDYDDWRGFYYDYDELTPGPVLQTTEQLADWALSLEPGACPPEVEAFRERFMAACDGHATERIVAAALGEADPDDEPEPDAPAEPALADVPTPAGIAARAKGAVREGLRHASYDFVFPAAYRLSACRPVNPRKALFVEQSASALSNSLATMWATLQRQGFDCELFSLRKYELGQVAYAQRCKELTGKAGTARLIFMCEACPPIASLPIRPETSVVQLWHGCGAFKKFGLSTSNKRFGATLEERLRHPEHASTTLVTVSSPEVRWAYEEAMGLEGKPGVVRALGVSRTDAFFDEGRLAAWREQATSAVPAIEGRRVLLWAPTFRGEIKTATAPDFLDIPLLRERLGDGWVLLVKHHPHVKERPPIPADCADWAFDVTRSLPIEAAMVASDACASDYSSLVFEYSLLGRPMAFLAPDVDDYDDWRGFYYDYDELTPGPVLQTTEQLADWALSLEPGACPPEVEAFRERFMAACDGHATERIVAAALGMGEPGDTAAESTDLSARPDSVVTPTIAHERVPSMSVVVPVYNSSEFLQRCVASLDAQTASQDSFEVVLVDDGSTDGSSQLCEQYVLTHPNYVCVHQPNQGVSAARNKGISLARGRYIMFLDPDDTISAPSIEYLVRSFNEFGDAVDLVTYPLVYRSTQTGATYSNARYRYMPKTGVYNLNEHPFVVQSTINVCVRNCGDATRRFDTSKRHYEDQAYLTQELCAKHAMGFCAEAQYTYYREPTSVTMASDLVERSFDDVMSAFELFVDLAQKNPEFARYAYALVLYNVGWRLREHKLFPDFGSAQTRARNRERLARVLAQVPKKNWEESPFLSDLQRVYMMRYAGIFGEVGGASYAGEKSHVLLDNGDTLVCGMPSIKVYWAVRERGATCLKALLYGPGLLPDSQVSLAMSLHGREMPLALEHLSHVDFADGGVPLGCVWHMDLQLPSMDGGAYDARLHGTVDGQAVDAFSMHFDVCRSNGRKIDDRVREFVNRRMVLGDGTIHVGTIKDVPRLASPAVVLLMRHRDKTRTGKFNAKEVRSLRESLPMRVRSYAHKRVWLYIDAGDVLERDSVLADGVTRLSMHDLDDREEKLAVFLGAERVVSAYRSLDDMLPCERDTWDRIADLSTVQEFVYHDAGETWHGASLLGTPFDRART